MYTEIYELFKKIGREDISENDKELMSSCLLSSIEYLSLISEIENIYGTIPVKYLDIENFESFSAILKMLEEISKGK